MLLLFTKLPDLHLWLLILLWSHRYTAQTARSGFALLMLVPLPWKDKMLGMLWRGAGKASKGELSAPISHFLRPLVIELLNTFSCHQAIKPPWHWSAYERIAVLLSHAQKYQARSQRIDEPIELPENTFSCQIPDLTSSEHQRKDQK